MPNNKKVSEEALIDTASDLLDELEEHKAEMDEAAKAAGPVKTLAHGTKLSTNTVYVDRTKEPEAERDVEYETSEETLGNGTVLVNVVGVKA